MDKINVRQIAKCDNAKLQELILYIASKSLSDERFGAIKLNKILYYSDFIAYRDLGSPITCADYQNLSEGPAPKQLVPCRDTLIKQGDAKIETRFYFNSIQERVVAIRPPKLDIFNLKELAIVDQVIANLLPFGAKEVSGLSHEEYGWRLTERREIIPYRTAWLSPDSLTEEQMDYGTKLWKEIIAR